MSNPRLLVSSESLCEDWLLTVLWTDRLFHQITMLRRQSKCNVTANVREHGRTGSIEGFWLRVCRGRRPRQIFRGSMRGIPHLLDPGRNHRGPESPGQEL